MERATRGVALVAASLLLLAATLTVGAAMAPDRGVSSTGDADGGTLVGSQGGGPGWHEKGSVYLVENDSIAWREDSADSYFDVTRLPNGTVMAGFMHSGYDSGCAPYDPPCTKTGFRIIDPEADGGPAVVSEYAFPVRTAKNSETHDVERLPSGEYLLSDMEHERIFTVQDGAVTWQWNASSFYDAPPDPTRRDWLHINDVDAVNETHYLVSVRNANQILLVSRGEGVVEVINEDRRDDDDGSCRVRGEQLADFDGDGDVTCGNPEILDHQHNPQWLGDGAVLVADSDNNRVVELHRVDGRWEPAWTLTRAGGIDIRWPRDADRLDNGNTLVTDTLNKRVFEVTPNGTVVWSTGTPDDSPIPYEAERLPEGERVGATQYDSTGTDGTPTETATGAGTETGSSVPGLSLLLVGIRAVAPWTPFWFGESHLALSLVAVVGVVAGSVEWARFRER
ncbi:arylsulfotransferase family protein [Haloarcula marina]|uniref:arylsulfotransferase family protein n=1 Tax=Haloarcula marina TaxID=2961574 RepID=UPI0020B689F4|nr:arylsulfotransferase family protein [Halomicroarcula marina]